MTIDTDIHAAVRAGSPPAISSRTTYMPAAV